MRKKLSLLVTLSSTGLWRELLVAAQLGICIAFFIYSLLPVFEYQRLIREFRRMVPDNMVYFQPYERIFKALEHGDSFDVEKAQSLREEIERASWDVPEAEAVGKIAITEGATNSEQRCTIAGYNADMLKRLNIPVQAGSDIETDTAIVNGNVPVLVRGQLARDHELGDTLTVKGYQGDFESFELNGYVVGKLSEDTRLLTVAYGGSEVVITDIFTPLYGYDDDSAAQGNLVLFNLDHLPNKDTLAPSAARYIFPRERTYASSDDLAKKHDFLGVFFTLDRIYADTFSREIAIQRDDIVQIIAILIFTFVTLYGFITTFWNRNSRYFQIYFVNGLSRKCLFALISVENIAIFIIGAFAALAIYPLLNSPIREIIKITPLVLALCVGAILVMMAYGVLLVHIRVKRWKPFTDIQEVEHS